jgi:hypothetical protein
LNLVFFTLIYSKIENAPRANLGYPWVANIALWSKKQGAF